VYGYLIARCGDQAVAEDLTSETFLAAARQDAPLSVAWLIGVARHKLVDHWRRQARQERLLRAVEGSSVGADDPGMSPWTVYAPMRCSVRWLLNIAPC
jgi:RNA polymerase sigma-70 factor (ECF subfamily)